MKNKIEDSTHNKLKRYIKPLTYIYIPVIITVFVVIAYWFIVATMFYISRTVLATTLAIIGLLITFVTIVIVSLIDHYMKPIRSKMYSINSCTLYSFFDQDTSGFIHKITTSDKQDVILFTNGESNLKEGMSIDVIVNKKDEILFAVPSLTEDNKIQNTKQDH